MRPFSFCGALFLAGCAGAPVAPFRTFLESARSAQKGLEAEAARDTAWTREAEVLSLAEDGDARLSAYLIHETSGASWTMDRPPAYWTARRSLRALEELNAAFLSYAGILVSAVSGETIDASRAEALAAGIHQAFRVWEESSPPPPLPAARGGFSAGASEAVRRLALRGRGKALEEALAANQPWVDRYAAHCAALTDLLRGSLKASYADQMDSIHRRWDDKRAPGRATLTRSVFNLNEDYVDAMETLQGLKSFYESLPAAHAELGAALRRDCRSAGKALAAVADSAGRVARLTRQLEKSK